ncbi:glycosyltransferase family 4 protein [Mucilaginibacter ginsenosidivorax]|uniref:Glycosyltransferase family 4 protein n=1 Tax=Mucilaginibacter ginsenosidivorax TaxID=862126 RepID=A0A5B8W7S2_9SPHI|nr:glycosyltransferase family 4 protein [Mucilaginibacter ginsenosidivorax]QEC80050.1 glycosyltransferase family 4 protein [Mucilaginibacter ginsenosidivorax]
MIKLVDLVYYSHLNYTRPQDVAEKHGPALAFAPYLNNKLDFTFVKHSTFEQHVVMDGVPYYFFKGKNRFWSITIKTHRFIKKLKPDIVMVQGLVFPLQVMFLRLFCGKKFKLIIQHHGELPSGGLKGRLQKMGCNMTDAFLFTSAGNADAWKQKGIIKPDARIFELLEASTAFKPIDKELAKKRTRITGDANFIWVSHLNKNKDPLTVLKGFRDYLPANPGAKLYMIYQSEALLSDIEELITSSAQLRDAVILVGEVANNDLPYWFSAADFYISGSHKEGSGYALLEAMACGCIPIVTSIPSYQKITVNGQYGFLYPAGDADALGQILNALEGTDWKKLSAAVLNHFNKKLSFKTIADDLVDICHRLIHK